MSESEAVTFLRSRMCYYHAKFKAQGRFALLWAQKRDNARIRLRWLQDLELYGDDYSNSLPLPPLNKAP